jgi:KaiC/GvpD/RAD55 family RecA-like ATPase
MVRESVQHLAEVGCELELLKSGLKELDRLLGGGLVNGKAYLLECAVGTKPRFLLSAFLKQGYVEGKLSRIDTLEYSIPEMIENLENSGFGARKAASEGKFLVVDYVNDRTYGTDLAGPYFSHGADMSIHGIGALSDAAWDKLRNTNPIAPGLRFAIQSATALIRRFGFEETLKYVDSQIASIKKWLGVFFITLNPETLSSVDLAIFEEVFEGIIELTIQEKGKKFQRYLRVKNSPLPTFVPERLSYEIIDGGHGISIAPVLTENSEED